MSKKDSRLLSSRSIPEIDENFIRVIAMIEELIGESVYQIMFNAYDGTVVNPQYKRVGQLLDVPTSTLTNHEVEGWYRDEGFTSEWDFAKDKVLAKDKSFTLFANWVGVLKDLTITATNCTVQVLVGETLIDETTEDAFRYGNEITINVIPDENYEISVLTVNDDAFVEGSVHEVVGDVTIVATCTEIV